MVWFRITTLSITNRPIGIRSGEPWTIWAAGTLSVGVVQGATYMGSTSSGALEWLVEDGGILEVGYVTKFSGEPDPTDFQNGYGTWTLMDHNNVWTDYEWKAEGPIPFLDPILDLPVAYSPYIEHDGATPAMNLNNPVDGDIDIWGADFYA